jgi:hypothetical protein
MADTVKKIENRTAPEISHGRFLGISAAARRSGADTSVCGRFRVNRCGPSRRADSARERS